MSIHRACTYSAAIQTPEAPSEYSEIVVSFMQDQELLVSKTKDDLAVSEDGVLVTLTQEETKVFRPSVESPTGKKLGGPVYMQIRVYADESNAPGSECWSIDVQDSLSDEILGSEGSSPDEPETPEEEEEEENAG